MNKTNSKRILSAILCMVLIAALALMATGCSAARIPNDGAGKEQAISLGEGATQFYFTVIDLEGDTTWYDVQTDKTVVGDALLDLKLIEGYESTYGLYVTTVNGITVDYDKDGKYWAFYVDGEYATAGVDSTAIEAGKTYTFKAE